MNETWRNTILLLHRAIPCNCLLGTCRIKICFKALKNGSNFKNSGEQPRRIGLLHMKSILNFSHQTVKPRNFSEINQGKCLTTLWWAIFFPGAGNSCWLFKEKNPSLNWSLFCFYKDNTDPGIQSLWGFSGTPIASWRPMFPTVTPPEKNIHGSQDRI